MRQLSEPMRVAVLASGRGSNLEALVAARDRGEANIELVLVGSNKADAQALQRAAGHGIPSLHLDPHDFPDRASHDAALLDAAAAHGAEIVVLAGYMRVLSATALQGWQGRIINIHPSLLPRHRGLHTHQRVLDAGEREHGASVHFVTAELDGGPLIAQVRMDVRADDDAASLAARLLPLEHRLLSAVVAIIADRALVWAAQGPVFHGRLLDRPLLLGKDGLGLHSAPSGQAGGS